MAIKKYRKRLKGNLSLKSTKLRQLKGHSSDCNPTIRKHRNAVKGSRFFATKQNRQNSSDIAKLPIASMSLDENEQQDAMSEFGMSQLSQFTNCTNPTFAVVHKVWKFGSTLQTDVLAVLGGVAELIQSEKGRESDTEYFAALLTLLNGISVEQKERLTATAYLLNLVIKKVSIDVLRKEYARASEIIYPKLAQLASSECHTAVKNLLGSLGTLIRCQSSVIWTNPSSPAMLKSIASFCVHNKPGVRLVSRQIVRSILMNPLGGEENKIHPAAKMIADLALSYLKEGSTSYESSVHTLSLLEGILHTMPSCSFKLIVDAIFCLLSFADTTQKCAVFQVLSRSFMFLPNNQTLSPETNEKILLAIMDLEPVSSGIAVARNWMKALSEALICLKWKDSNKSSVYILKCIDHFISSFEVGDESLAQIASSVILRCMEFCVDKDQSDLPVLDKVLEKLDAALNMHTVLVWPVILETQSLFFKQFGVDCVRLPSFERAVKNLSEMRETEEECDYRAEIEQTIGAAVRYVSPSKVIELIAFDLNFDFSSSEIKRSWLLPLLRKNIPEGASLAIFYRYLLPTAMKLQQKMKQMEKVPSVLILYETVFHQFWDLLPSFASGPCDLAESFPKLAHILGAALVEYPDLRLTVLAALRSLVKFALSKRIENEVNADLQTMSNYAKNYLPILFNLYTKTLDETASSVSKPSVDVNGVRLSVLETIRVYIDATPPHLIEQYIKSALENKMVKVYDILAALTKQADLMQLQSIFDHIFPLFESTDAVYQKKAFRILEEIFRRREDSIGEEFLRDNSNHIQNTMIQSLHSVAPSARPARISVCRHLVDMIQDSTELNKLSDILIPQLIPYLDKSASRSCCENAAKCLVELSQKLVLTAADGRSPSSVLHSIFEIMYAMSPTDSCSDVNITSATTSLCALAIMAKKFGDYLDAITLTRLICHGCEWVPDGRPLVRMEALRLLKILIGVLPEFSFTQYREQIATTVFAQGVPNVTHRLRTANRRILEVLVERFGAEILAKYTDKSEWLKQIKNIQKGKRRKQRKMETNKESGYERKGPRSVSSIRSKKAATTTDSILELLQDSDTESSDAASEDDGKSSKKGSVWLKEGDEEELTDLLDRKSLAKKVRTTQPSQTEKGRKRKSAHPTSKDGCLLLDFSANEVKNQAAMKSVQSLMKNSRISGENAEEVCDGGSDDEEESNTYQAGGSGIHRNTQNDGKKRNRKVKAKKVSSGMQPYAYVPLRKRKGSDIKALIQGATKGKVSKKEGGKARK